VARLNTPPRLVQAVHQVEGVLPATDVLGTNMTPDLVYVSPKLRQEIADNGCSLHPT
jgi:hypothetical protein